MKAIIGALIATSVLFATAAVAQQATTPVPANKADCEKAKMRWDEKGGKDGKGACVAAMAKPAETPKK